MGKIQSPFIGRGRGILGSIVMYHMPKYTGVRQRTQTIRNPQSNTQMYSRCCLTTIQRAYSVLKPISNHAFEGAIGDAMNQRLFVANNMKVMEGIINNNPTPSECFNFNQKTQMLMMPNGYMVSRGTLLPCRWTFSGLDNASSIIIPFGGYHANMSYEELLQLQGHTKGIQYTFIMVLGNASTGECSDIEYCRVIMEPANGDMSTAFVNERQEIVSPNPKNEGTEKFRFIFMTQQPFYGIAITLKDEYLAGRQVLAGVMIASKGTGKKALRSTEYLQFNFAGESEFSSLQQAIDSYRVQPQSSIYLNQGT